MPRVHQEHFFESGITDYLTSQNWLAVDKAGFDQLRGVHPDELLDFLRDTQQAALDRLAQVAGSIAKAETDLVDRVVADIDAFGTLHVLRKGVKDRGVKFELAYFRPAHGLTPQLLGLYRANRCGVARQLRYSPTTADELDLALFLNGLVIATGELKNPLTHQNVEDAKKQYRDDRDRNDKTLNKRALVHFAVDPDLVFLTTKLDGQSTTFLPFNLGDDDGGAGNPVHPSGLNTAYLWEQVWHRDAWLDVIHRFLHYETDRDTGAKRLLFPRFHQWDAVVRLRAAAASDGPGVSYLIQHSAGSGKSNTIGWLAHQLASLHSAQDKKVFDKVIVITDRRVLDQQLQDTVFEFEHTPGMVVPIEKDSAQLSAALAAPGAQIIITTLQKFSFILDEVRSLPSSTYAVLVDEAHSSQTGESAKDLKAALGERHRTDEEVLAQAELEDEPALDAEDFVAQSVAARGRQPNLSFFAFTATPKQKTLELFGWRNWNNLFEPFHVYTMRQAVEEGFILDVLRSYTTYKTYWRLAQRAGDDPELDRARAAQALARFVTLHPHNVAQKTEVIVEHFRRSTRHKIGGRAKAMVVTRTRLHAVRYKQAFDAYVASKGYTDIRALVAFSGKVIDENRLEYTEPEMNGGIPESKLPEHFASDDYQVLIAAEKYQTGFDEPLLHTMYVDKKLEGVKAVQTLSRLNRTTPGKDDTFVLDFVNEASQIQASFAPWFETSIAEPTDPNLVYQAQAAVEAFPVIASADVDAFIAAYASVTNLASAHAALYRHLEPARRRYRELSEDDQEQFRSSLAGFVRVYAFLAQVVPFADRDLEVLYLYARFLALRLDAAPRRGLDLSETVELTHLRIELQGTQTISLTSGGDPLRGFTGELPGGNDQEVRLSEIVQKLNDRFGTSFTDADQVYFDQLVQATVEDAELGTQARVNSIENWALVFRRKFENIVVDRRASNEALFGRFVADRDFAQLVTDWVMARAYERFHSEGEIGFA